MTLLSITFAHYYINYLRIDVIEAQERILPWYRKQLIAFFYIIKLFKLFQKGSVFVKTRVFLLKP